MYISSIELTKSGAICVSRAEGARRVIDFSTCASNGNDVLSACVMINSALQRTETEC